MHYVGKLQEMQTQGQGIASGVDSAPGWLYDLEQARCFLIGIFSQKKLKSWAPPVNSYSMPFTYI